MEKCMYCAILVICIVVFFPPVLAQSEETDFRPSAQEFLDACAPILEDTLLMVFLDEAYRYGAPEISHVEAQQLLTRVMEHVRDAPAILTILSTHFTDAELSVWTDLCQLPEVQSVIHKFTNHALSPSVNSAWYQDGWRFGEEIRVLMKIGLENADALNDPIRVNELRCEEFRGQTMMDMGHNIAAGLRKYQETHQTFPVQLTEADWSVQQIHPECSGYFCFLTDLWGMPFRYWSDGKHYRLTSYGCDRKKGHTEGYALGKDIVLTENGFMSPY